MIRLGFFPFSCCRQRRRRLNSLWQFFCFCFVANDNFLFFRFLLLRLLFSFNIDDVALLICMEMLQNLVSLPSWMPSFERLYFCWCLPWQLFLKIALIQHNQITNKTKKITHTFGFVFFAILIKTLIKTLKGSYLKEKNA